MDAKTGTAGIFGYADAGGNRGVYGLQRAEGACDPSEKGLKSCAKEILGELWQKIDVDFLYEMVRQVENVRIWFSGAL